ncbi:ABC transporter ATP-binding protein [Natronohydrobacter thiooxidans]|jgi:ABC-type sugar transport system ATPase subunit|uniref:ABC transporter ATP-binding protein n=1 Tax=Natronohydrobacter thiooxidans TaxID=87172 RepID=UPI0008FF5DB7|nr:sn-glycerol-3-phosphate ABC transporter ATP-binding protein UgpC [Natronohydrobacter thiooxidans]
MAQLTLTNVRKSFGSLEVLKGIDLSIESGELIVFVGPSGCGKSTLLRLIAGLDEITEGTLEIEGRVVNDVPAAKRRIAMVFQSYALYPHMTVRRNMAFGLKMSRLPRAEIERRVANAATMLKLEPLMERLPKQLSGGQRQRVAIGRAITREPAVFLFDEPLSNLDAALRVATRIEIAGLHERLPAATMIYVTHDQVEAMTLADRIVVMNAGRIEQVGTPMELYHRPANEFVAQFIGSPAMNVLPAEEIANGNFGPRAKTVGIRPEDLRLVDSEPLITGKVLLVEQLGEVTLAYARTETGRSISVKLPGDHAIARDDVISIGAPLEKVHCFDQDGLRVSQEEVLTET